jgi:hypothetical protein
MTVRIKNIVVACILKRTRRGGMTGEAEDGGRSTTRPLPPRVLMFLMSHLKSSFFFSPCFKWSIIIN